MTNSTKNSRTALRSVKNVSKAVARVAETKESSITNAMGNMSLGTIIYGNESILRGINSPRRSLEAYETHSARNAKEYDEDTYLDIHEEEAIHNNSVDTNVESELNHLNPSTSTIDSQWNPQSFYIDFTPTKEDELYYDKCIEFWEMINANEDIQRLIVSPEPESVVEKETDVATTTEEDIQTIVDMNDYDHYSKIKFPAVALVPDLNKNKIQTMKMNEACGSSTASSYYLRTMAKDDVANVCKDMDEFDRKNPKSMEPPGHSDTLKHAELRRLRNPPEMQSVKK